MQKHDKMKLHHLWKTPNRCSRICKTLHTRNFLMIQIKNMDASKTKQLVIACEKIYKGQKFTVEHCIEISLTKSHRKRSLTCNINA